VPPDLATMIDDQLRQLSQQALRLLQACALLGQHSTLPRVERVLGMEAPALVSPFGELDDMLALPSEPGQPMTPHDLWTDRVRRGMTAGVFRSLAVSAARVLEADAQADGGIEIYWDAARLYQESGEKQLAYATMMRCAEYSMRTGATSDASRAYDAAAEYAANPLASYAALLGRTRAQQTNEAWDDVLETVSRTLSLAVDWTPDQQADLELSRMSAEWSVGTDDSSMVARLRQIIGDVHLLNSTRLSAAVLGMAASDNGFDAEGVRWFYSAIAGLAVSDASDELALLKCTIIFETAVGDLSKAEDAAIALVAQARRLQDTAALISALKFAHYPPRRLGQLSLAQERLQSALHLAERYKRPHARATIVDLLAGLNLEYGNYEEAIRLTHDVTDQLKPLGGAFRQQSAADTRAIALCLAGRYDAARHLVAAPNEVMARGRRRTQFLSLAASMLVATCDRDTQRLDACLSEFDAVRDRLFRHSGSDVIAVAYASALLAARGRRIAAEFVHWYAFEARRDRLPLPIQLTAPVEA
jgi:hypothetical protein